MNPTAPPEPTAQAEPSTPRRDPTPTPWLRHLCHFGGIAGLCGLAFILAAPRGPMFGPLGLLYAVAVTLNVYQLALSGWSSVLGGLVGLARAVGRDASRPVLAPPTGRSRTAVLMPVFEEHPARVVATMGLVADLIAAEQAGPHSPGTVDLFVLSDTRSTAIAAAEERTLARLQAQRGAGGPPIFYRRRVETAGRKAGNVAEWIARWGAYYHYAVVLDADSLMSGAAITRLIGAMDANPNAGLIQAMCFPIGRSTLFARMQQFSARLYGPVFQRGVSFWQGPRGNFWGHNAILRTADFATHCGLPILPGAPPLGGEILSHDTVEAALMLRGGADVWMLPDGPGGRHDGSWEETPTNFIDHLGRDRRWCTGNMQHTAVLRADGLRLASLYHLVRGLLHYLYVAPLLVWAVLFALVGHRQPPAQVAALATLVAALVVAPRAISLVAALGEDRAGFGGALRLAASTLLDSVASWLLYPVTAAFHCSFLIGTMSGHEVRWDTQARDDRDLPWREAARMLAPTVLVALAVTLALSLAAPTLALAFAPGLVAAIPFAVWTSRHRLGRRTYRWGLFVTPDELRVPPAWTARAALEARLVAATAEAPLAVLPPENGLAMPRQSLRRRTGTAPVAASTAPAE